MVLHGNAHRTIICTVVGLLLANGGVALRFMARNIGGIKITLDDYLMLLALIPYWGLGVVAFITQNGLGQSLVQIPPHDLQIFLKVQYAGTFAYGLTIFFTKASILAMYWRVLPTGGVRRNVYLCGGFIVAWNIAVCMTGALACIPVNKSWTPEIEGHCIDWAPFYYGIQIPNILNDIYIVIIPLREVFELKMTKVQKNILIGIFGIAALTVVFDIVHFIAIVEFSKSKEDFTISIINPSTWTIIEPAVGIFATCLSNLRPLFRRLAIRSQRPQLIEVGKEDPIANMTSSRAIKTADTSDSGIYPIHEALKLEPLTLSTGRRRSRYNV